MDIFLGNDKEAGNEQEIIENRDHICLSRRFYYVINRRWSNGPDDVMPELEQIAEITGVDISPIYQMADYQEEDFSQNLFNLEIVDQTVATLIEKLSEIDNLPELLKMPKYNNFWITEYFSDLKPEGSENLHFNNFAEDLKNIRNYINMAKAWGARTVWLMYA